MYFRKTTFLLSLALLTTTDIAAANQRQLKGVKASKSSKSSKGTKMPKLAKQSSSECVTEAEVIETVGAFGGTVPAVADAYRNGGCHAAWDQALGSLDAAYGYNLGPVLFKPTLSSIPYTFRNTLAGALSYFVGTDCLLAVINDPSPDGVARTPLVFPDGNEDGSIFKENGFGLGPGPTYGNGPAWNGFEHYPVETMTGGKYCDTALHVGQICFTYQDPTGADRASCVDKTFSVVKGDPAVNALSGVIASHHSSQVVTTSSTLTSCQVPPVTGTFPDFLPDMEPNVSDTAPCN